ncbi:hypothetical protein J3L16_14890 [Alteromonas sp. 5E99-2]|uniref:hypothetical protein n=1 Tax=Alteromonas sp. 5E99-2 TaxID=2817683 RepID=UPI001A98A7B6|nr:hypothetical protein [Alteromonas sp. 5E99-2]MBO1256979.1 hypothetical protein [Alteromonas sp. 5E99-2]
MYTNSRFPCLRNNLTFISLVLNFGFSSYDVVAQPRLKLNAFATIALTHEDNSDLEFSRSFYTNKRDGTSILTDSVIGFQANWLIQDKLDVFAQVNIEDSLFNELDTHLQTAFIRYSPSRNWSLLAGRINSNIYMLSDSRVVGHTYLWARAPTEIYSQSELVEAIDGLGVKYRTKLFEGFTSFHAAFGHAEERNEASKIKIDDSLSISAEWTNFNFTLFTAYTKGNIVVTGSDVLDNSALAFANIPQVLWPNAQLISSRLGTSKVSSAYLTAGLKYDRYPFIIQSELSRTNINWLVSNAYYAGYLSLGYRYKQITPFIVGAFINPEQIKTNLDVPEQPDFVSSQVIAQLNQLSDTARSIALSAKNDHTRFSVGLRWDLYSNTAIKFQYDHFIVNNAGSIGPVSTSNGQVYIEDKNLNLLHIGLNLVF